MPRMLSCTISSTGLSIWLLPEANNAAARFKVRVWTVILSGFNWKIPSNVRRNPSGVSPGSPAIKSILMFLQPISRAKWNASMACCAVCLLPMVCKTVSSRVCGLTEIRSAPIARMVCSFSFVMVSGRPASTQYSRRWEQSKQRVMVSMIRAKSAASREVGVPPPK